MSSKSSDFDQACLSDDDSEFNYIPGKYNIETEIMEASASDNGDGDILDQETGPYSNEPMADEQWAAEYRQRQAEKESMLASLKDRLAGKETLSSW